MSTSATKKSLLLVAHGSRRPESNDEIRRLTECLRRSSEDFDRIECAFLEIESPSIPEGIRYLIEEGSTHIRVLPYFLSRGRHVVDDIPREIKVVAREFPDIVIEQAPYIGQSPELVSMMLGLARAGTND